jgi:hypothetical protein
MCRINDLFIYLIWYTPDRRLGSNQNTLSLSSFPSMYSDQRLNNNVQDISKAIEKLTMIRGVAFKYLNLVQCEFAVRRYCELLN